MSRQLLLLCDFCNVFLAKPITSETLRAALAVVQLATPEASLPEFRRWVTTGRLAVPKGQAIGLFDQRDYAHAVFRANVVEIGTEQGLRVSDFLYGDQISMSFMIGMIDAVQVWAKGLGCDQLTIQTTRTSRAVGLPMSDVLVFLGFSGESVLMGRRL